MGDIADALRQSAVDAGKPAARRRAEAVGEQDAGQSLEWLDEPGPVVQIPSSRDVGWEARAVWVTPHGPVAEAFRHLALRVRSDLEKRRVSSILITSAVPTEGKTVTACNLALAFASMESEQRIALVELDLRSPGFVPALGVRPEVGFEQVLRGEAPLADAAIRTEAQLDVYAVVRPDHEAHQILARRELADVLRNLEAGYRFVVYDAPPSLPVPDVQILAEHVGACLVVVRAGRTARSAFEELMKCLPSDKLIGSFLNDSQPSRHARRYYSVAYSGGSEDDGAPDARGDES